MTGGDDALAAEVLGLFAAQLEATMATLRGAAPIATGPAAHRLKGAALGVGAFRVAAAAEAVEQAGTDAATLAAALRHLEAEAAEAGATASRLAAQKPGPFAQG
ncbi:MAG: Hpt domain-containing protein [Rhizobiales bacterium]|nr:Hpt domain-containing protein [Hyphomicrobiales bacterium]